MERLFIHSVMDEISHFALLCTLRETGHEMSINHELFTSDKNRMKHRRSSNGSFHKIL